MNWWIENFDIKDSCQQNTNKFTWLINFSNPCILNCFSTTAMRKKYSSTFGIEEYATFIIWISALRALQIMNDSAPSDFSSKLTKLRAHCTNLLAPTYTCLWPVSTKRFPCLFVWTMKRIQRSYSDQSEIKVCIDRRCFNLVKMLINTSNIWCSTQITNCHEQHLHHSLLAFFAVFFCNFFAWLK